MPLDCEQIRNEFSALLDDELNAEDRELVEEHLSDCSDCLRELHGYQQVSDAYRYHHPVKAPKDFEDRLRERMAPTAMRHRLPARTWLSLAAAAGVTLVAGVVLWQKPLPEQAVFQLSRNDATSVESAPMAEELAPAPRDLDGTAPELGRTDSDAAFTTRMAEEPQMSAVPAAPSPEAAPPQAEPSAEGAAPSAFSNPIAESADPRMKQSAPANDTAPVTAGENALALRSAPADSAPDEAADLRTMRQDSTAAANTESARDSESAQVPAPEPEGERAAASASMKESPADDAEGAPPARSASTLEWREHTFTLQDGTWRQNDYAGEETTQIPVPSDAWNKVLDEHNDLNQLVGQGAPVIVKLGETWYEFRRAETAPPETPDQGR